MSYSADQFVASVVKPGGMSIVENSYKGDGSTTLAKGDLVRVNTSGRIVDAAADSSTTGPIHGMNVATWATAPTTSQFVTILEFAHDTELEMQLYAASAGDAEPQDVTIGVAYTIRNSAAGIWCATVTTTNGIFIATKRVADVAPYWEALDEDYGPIWGKFSEANLAAHGS